MKTKSKVKKFIVRKVVRHAVREYITLVDEQDAHLLRAYYWTIIHGGEKSSHTEYVGRAANHEQIFLHKVIADAKQGEIVRHINGDGLDNRRCNLLKASDRVEEVE